MSVAIGVVIQSGPRCRFARRPREEMFAVLRLLFPMWESAGRAGFLHPPMGFFTRKALVNPASLAFFPSCPLLATPTNSTRGGPRFLENHDFVHVTFLANFVRMMAGIRCM